VNEWLGLSGRNDVFTKKFWVERTRKCIRVRVDVRADHGWSAVGLKMYQSRAESRQSVVERTLRVVETSFYVYLSLYRYF